MHLKATFSWAVLSVSFLIGCVFPAVPAEAGSFQEMVRSKTDLWGEASLREKNGASYEFFKDLLPPPRYVNSDFRFYPIVLSAPNAPVKARLISNGSGVNLRGGSRSWNDNGMPAFFRVGPDEGLFGDQLQRLEHPTLADGYLPVVEIRYLHPTPVQSGGNVPLNQTRFQGAPEIYQLEAFVSVDPAFAENAVVFVKFSVVQGTNGFMTVAMDSRAPLKFSDGIARDEKGQILAGFDQSWTWARGSAHARLSPKKFAYVAIPTKALEKNLPFSVDADVYAQQRQLCVETHQSILAQGMKVQTPEPLVNNAWRHLVLQNFALINGDRIHYSHGNQYDKLYEAEGSDTALAMMVWGYEKDTPRLMVPLFDFTRKGLEYHQAGFKLLDITRYYWLTRDAGVMEQMRQWPKPKSYQTSANESVSGWEIEARRLAENRTGPHGMFPPEQYCGDISTKVQSINVNAKAWRALRDLSAVLAEVGETNQANHYEAVARDFRKTVLTAVEKSVDRSTTPPFVPVALFTNELAHSPICDTRIGCYWNIIIGYTISSGIFPPGSEQENWLPHYQEQHGGLALGMLRAGGQENTFWNSEHRINPLYGTRYALDVLRRDDPERALVSLYGMLAQGMTRNTFVGGEGVSLKPLDEGGRSFIARPTAPPTPIFCPCCAMFSCRNAT